MSLFSQKETVKLDVAGMHCEKCVARVKAALEGVDGVTKATVDLESNSAVAEGRGFETAEMIAAIEACGFQAAVAE